MQYTRQHRPVPTTAICDAAGFRKKKGPLKFSRESTAWSDLTFSHLPECILFPVDAEWWMGIRPLCANNTKSQHLTDKTPSVVLTGVLIKGKVGGGSKSCRTLTVVLTAALFSEGALAKLNRKARA